ncbi:MAG: hypothetical protein SV910_07435 [Chloroflexota bacterium]|nr:hypothetical protein [Chloroflexota bacterium]
MVSACHRAIARDVIERAAESGPFAGVVVVTDMAGFGDGLGRGVVVEPGGSSFHFGQALKDVIERHGIERPLYVGRGSLPLISAHELGELARKLGRAQDTVITNNPYSADVVAFAPGSAIARVELPAADNPLPQLLVRQAGLGQVALPRTAVYQFDVDTPADLLVLALHPGAGAHTRACIEGMALDASHVERASALFADPDGQVVVAGRIGSHVWSRLEAETSCRVRVLSEERSMHTDERERRGEVRTILGFYLEHVSFRRFFDTLGELGHAAFIDTRVLFSHRGLKPLAADRFYSDLRQPQHIADPFVREFTAAAIEAPIPVVLGGHSLVSGGLLALIEVARMRHGGAPA